MKRIGIIPNLDKRGAREITLGLLSWLEERGVRAYLPEDIAVAIGATGKGSPISDWACSVDFIIVLGGDGTLLSAARRVVPAGTPLLGVNLGHLGFLTEVEVPNLYDALPAFLDGEYEVEKRMMVEASVVRRGRKAASFLALNEVTITKGPFARLIRLDLYIDERYVETYPADGIIIATPTGSTAYSLSAGGPIVNPQLDVVIITPICPHTLYSRPLVISGKELVRVSLRGPNEDSMLTIDGQEGYPLAFDDEVLVTPARESVRLMRTRGWSFYEVLRKKMKEGTVTGSTGNIEH